jgi:molybdopterin synthase sulfur carrier subunit
MEITVRLFATFREGRGKESKIDCVAETTVRQLADILAIKPQDIAILLVNGRDYDLDSPLKAGDTVSLFPPVGGG